MWRLMWAFRRNCEGRIFFVFFLLSDQKLTASCPPTPAVLPHGSKLKRQSGRSSGVEHNLAKVGVEGSNPFARSKSFDSIKYLKYNDKNPQFLPV